MSYVLKFKDEAGAVRLANESLYGLPNSVCASNLTRANHVAEPLQAANSLE